MKIMVKTDSAEETEYSKELADKRITEAKIYIRLEDLGEGKHHLEVSAEDCAGIPASAGKSEPEFISDFSLPEGILRMTSESKKLTDAEGQQQDWFDGAENVEYQFEVSDKLAENPDIPGKITVTVRDEQPDNVFSYDINITEEMADENNRYQITQTLLNDIFIRAAAEGISFRHNITVSASVSDFAGNTADMGSVTIHRDLNLPVIENQTVSVSKAPDTFADALLRVLTFGIYSNDRIRYTVTVLEEDGDSGVQSVGISTDGGTEWLEMQRDDNASQDGKAVYVLDVPAEDSFDFDTQTCSGIIDFKVTDRFGKENQEFKAVANGSETTESRSFMTERKIPDVHIVLPQGDGAEREDGEIWYRDNKEITLSAQDKESGVYQTTFTVNEEKRDIVSNEIRKEEETSEVQTAPEDTAKHEYLLYTDDLMLSAFSAEGSYTLQLSMEDNAGNTGTDVKTFHVDKTIPAVNNISFSVESADGESSVDAAAFVKLMRYGFYFQRDFTATVSVSDEMPSSGLYMLYYRLVPYQGSSAGQTEESVSINEDGTASFLIPAGFKGQVYVSAADMVGNRSEEVTPEAFVIDTPDRHESEKHVFFELDSSDYRDNDGYAMYQSAQVSAAVVDTMSGIRSFTYYTESENSPEPAEQTIQIDDDANYAVGDELQDGWVIAAMDENLVTRVEKVFDFAEDDNHITLHCTMTDRANNVSSDVSRTFTVDTTPPEISIAFVNDEKPANGNYYQNDRIVKVTVKERNFNASGFEESISPGVVRSFNSLSDTEHEVILTLSEGDYQFDGVSVTDAGGNTSSAKIDEKDRIFFVDQTPPQLNESAIYQNFPDSPNTETGYMFNSEKTIPLIIKEHHFDANLVTVKVERASASRKDDWTDCTKDLLKETNWKDTGDLHTLELHFTNDGVYRFSVQVTDKSGRELSPEYTSRIFEIDTTPPELSSSVADENGRVQPLIYTNPNQKVKAITFKDDNISQLKYTVISHKADTREEDNYTIIGMLPPDAEEDLIQEGNTFVLDEKYLSSDGIYEVICTAYDMAGNESNSITHTFVILTQSENACLAYVPVDTYDRYNNVHTRYDNFENFMVTAFVKKDAELDLSVEDQNISSDYHTDEKTLEPKITGVDVHELTLINEEVDGKDGYIKNKYHSDVDTEATFNIELEGGQKKLTLMNLYIDNTSPGGKYNNTNDKTEKLFDTSYSTKTFTFYSNDKESETIVIDNLEDDVDIEKCFVERKRKGEKESEKLTFKDADLQYYEGENKITIKIPKGEYTIKPTLFDKAGNESMIPSRTIFVGSVWERFGKLIMGSIIGGLAVIFAILASIFKKIKKN